jgi:hypothetical protein
MYLKNLYCKLHLTVPYGEANCNSATLEIHRRLWNPKVYYIVHSRSPLVPIPKHMNTGQIIPSEFFKILAFLALVNGIFEM